MTKIETMVETNEMAVENRIDNEYPLIPLRNIVPFPNGQPLPLAIGRKKSLEALRVAMNLPNGQLVLAAQKEADIEDVSVDDIYRVGVIAVIEHHMALPDGTVRVIVRPLERVKIKEFSRTDTYFSVIVEKFPDKKVELNSRVIALMRAVVRNFVEYFNKQVSDVRISADMLLKEYNDPAFLSFVVAPYIKMEVSKKQEILEMDDPVARLEALLKILQTELAVLKAAEEIEEKVKSSIAKSQREMYLREQLKAIKEELGELSEVDNTIEEYRKRIEAAGMPEDVKEKALRELRRLEKMHPFSPEANVIRTYLDWLVELPWNKRTEDNLDIKNAKKILDEDHYGLKEPKERILEYLAVKQLSPNSRAPILCFVGPPGVGKTSLGRSIARAMGRKFVRISLGGVHDEAEIRGHRRTYVGALPGRIIQGIRKAGTKNPLFLLDEIDKLGRDFRGDPAAALLEVLDPDQNKSFVDHYLEVPFDLSEVLFVTTANVTHTIPEPLLDRIDVIYIPGYIDWEKLQISKRHLIPRLLKDMGLNNKEVSITDNAILRIIREYTREAGVRNLERQLAQIFRKIAREIVESGGKKRKFRIGVKDIPKYLGVPKFDYTKAERKPEVGLVNGLAWTPYGGDILNIEAIIYNGKGKLILTGRLGEVMKESGHAALSFLRSRASKYKIDEDLFDKKDIHIHVPEGAIPKDGPSAGIALATVMYSVLKELPVPQDVAMTGEITLRGKVLPVGGLKEKLLAAHRGGIKKVLIPKDNAKDLTNVPDRVKKDLVIIPVSHMDEVIKEVFNGGRKKTSR